MTRKLLLSIAGLIGGSLAVQGQIIATINTSAFYVVDSGAYDTATGQFTRANANFFEGVATSFAPVTLDTIGDYAQVSFRLAGGGANNSGGNNVAVGLFNGNSVSANGQTSVTAGWTGYFSGLGTRDSSGDVNYALYRQGSGTASLMDYATNWSSVQASVDGNGNRITGGFRPALNTRSDTMSPTIDVSVRVVRTGANQLQMTTVFATARVDGTGSGTIDGIAFTTTVVSGVATIVATHNAVNDFTFSGFALMGRGTNDSGTSNAGRFNLTDVELAIIPEPSTYAALIGLLALGFVAWRRRR